MIIPAVVGALVLGIAFDKPSLTTRPYYVYDSNAIRKSNLTIENPNTKSHFRIIESSSESNNFLNVNGELALRAKYGRGSGMMQALGKYLIHPINRKKTIEILVAVQHETVVETFPSYTPQKEEWRSKKPEQVGTHYIRSIVYGGQLVISCLIHVHNEEDLESIKAAVVGDISVSGSFDAHVAGNLELLNRNFGSKFGIEINAYATTGVFNPPTTFESVLTLAEEYPDMVRKVNGGKGAPVRLELQSLSTLEPNFGTREELGGMEVVYQDAVNKLEDLKVADKEFREWEETQFWNDEQQEEIDRYFKRLGTAFSSMKTAISEMDARNGVSEDHFEQALKDYGVGAENIPNRYTRELANLTHHIENIPFYWYPYTTATTNYIHWGSINCSLPSVDPVYVGYAASSPKGFGNGGNILCLDMEPEFGFSKDYRGAVFSKITGMTYETPGKSTGFAYCAFCRLENATAVEMIAGRDTCPPDMKMEYTGYLATNLRTDSVPICMALEPDDKIVDLHARPDSTAGKIGPMWFYCDDCEEEEEEEKARYLSCVVCSR